MTGVGGLLRFMLRRERIALPWWLLGATLLVLIQSTQSQNLYDTPEDLANLRQTLGGNTAVIAMSGPVRLLETIGGEVVFEILAFVSIVVALMNMFLVGRHTRADEESGRAELVRSARVGRGATLAAALGLALLANLAVALLLFAVTAGTGLPAAGSILFGVSVATVGLTFAALTAVAVQVFENTRAAYGAVGLAIGAAFVLRAAGDAGNGALSWVSPIGWAQRTYPYVDNRWWPLLIPAVLVAALIAAALALLETAGLRRRPGPVPPGAGVRVAGVELAVRAGVAAAARSGHRLDPRPVPARRRLRLDRRQHRAVRGGQPRGGRVPPRRRGRHRGRVPGVDHAHLGR